MVFSFCVFSFFNLQVKTCLLLLGVGLGETDETLVLGESLDELGVVHHGVVVAEGVLVLLGELSLGAEAEDPVLVGGDGNIGDGQTLTGQEGAGLEPLLQAGVGLVGGGEVLLGLLLGGGSTEGTSDDEVVSGTLELVAVVEPLVDLGRLVGGATVEEAVGLVGAGDVTQDGVGLEDVAILGLQGRGAANGVAVVLVVLGLVIGTELEVHKVVGDTGHLQGGGDLPGPDVRGEVETHQGNRHGCGGSWTF
eukprot:250567_1